MVRRYRPDGSFRQTGSTLLDKTVDIFMLTKDPGALETFNMGTCAIPEDGHVLVRMDVTNDRGLNAGGLVS